MQYLTAPTSTLLAIAAFTCVSPVDADELRRWTDLSGQFSVKAEVVAADANLVVLERENGELIALKPDQLSKTDQQFIAKYIVARKSPTAPIVDSTWKLRDGEVIFGRLIGFGRQELIVKRERGDLWVHDRRLKDLPAAYQKILPNIVSVIDNKPIKDLDELEDHLADNGGGPFKYTVTGIQLDLKSWGIITVPLALLTIEEAKAIAPSFERWQASQKNEVSDDDRIQTESRERLALESRERLRRQNRRSYARKLKLLELGLLAVDA